MKTLRIGLIATYLLCLASNSLARSGGTDASSPDKSADNAVVTVEWPQLVPEDERKQLIDPAKVDHTKTPERPRTDPFAVEGGPGGSGGDAMDGPEFLPVQTWNNRMIRIAGYIVPTDYSPSGKINGFFLVPYFGACIHIPPPPPDQTIYVHYSKGLEFKDLYDPFQVVGRLKVENAWKELADAEYTMEAVSIEPYAPETK